MMENCLKILMKLPLMKPTLRKTILIGKSATPSFLKQAHAMLMKTAK